MVHLLEVTDKGVFHTIWYFITGIFHFIKDGVFKGIWSDKISTVTGWVMVLTLLKAANELLKSASIIFGDSKIQKWYIQMFHAFLRINYWVFSKLGIIWLVRNLNDFWHNIKNQKIVAEQRLVFQTEMLTFKENQEGYNQKQKIYQSEMIEWKEDQKFQVETVHAKIDDLSLVVFDTKEIVVSNTERIKKIEYENSPNSGGSTHDKISMTAEVVHEIAETVKSMYSEIFEVKQQAKVDFILMKEAAFVMDGKGQLVEANRAYLKLLGVPDIDIILGDNWKYSIIPKENLDTVKIAHADYQEMPREMNSPFEYVNYTTGEKVTLMVDTQILKDKQGNISKTIGYVSEMK